jgi:hypothetical protein
MLDFDSCAIEKVVVHHLGNKHNQDGVIASEELCDVGEMLNHMFRTYFFSSFKNVSTFYHFTHPSGMDQHILNNVAFKIFNGGDFIAASKEILDHLYEQSEHPHVRSGDLFVARFNNVIADDEVVEAFGVFKAERKEQFLSLENDLDAVEVKIEKGLNVNKLDKGVIIFNTNTEEGYKAVTVDANNYDAIYWMDDFLSVEVLEDKHYFTKNAINLIKGFAEDIIKPNNDTREQVNMLNQSVNYFKEEESFDLDRFADQVIKEPEYVDEFKTYAKIMEEERGIKVNETFDIAPIAVKQAKKEFKSIIALDTNMQIKLDFRDPNSSNQFLERGYDQDKGMYFYKLYFNRETK